MSKKENIVITGMARTPMGAFQGTLKDASCAKLGAASIRAALERSRVGADEVSETIMGCVLPAGQGQAPARQAALGAEMPLSVCCTTVNKMCGSGMKSAMLAHDLLLGGEERILVAGGMESMTNAPYLLPRARSGMRLGHGEVVDHMFLDGLEDAYDRGKLMGTFAEATAGRYGFSREAQDEFAIRSLTRAKKAIEEGIFKEEIFLSMKSISTEWHVLFRSPKNSVSLTTKISVCSNNNFDGSLYGAKLSIVKQLFCFARLNKSEVSTSSNSIVPITIEQASNS